MKLGGYLPGSMEKTKQGEGGWGGGGCGGDNKLGIMPSNHTKKLGPRSLANGGIGRMANFDTIMWLFMRFFKEMNKRQKGARNPPYCPQV
jgi:hypothetical protein